MLLVWELGERDYGEWGWEDLRDDVCLCHSEVRCDGDNAESKYGIHLGGGDLCVYSRRRRIEGRGR